MLDWDGDWVACKAAQVGITEVALNRSFFTIDIKKSDVMYVLPKADPDATQFSAGRFTPALELSPYLKDLFSDANSVGHKRAGANNLYVRGAQSRSGLKSVPAGLMIFDELDEMPRQNVELALERTSGQVEAQIIKISTPTLPGFGIDIDYSISTREHFFFKCPHCNKYIELKFPESIVITAESLTDSRIGESHYICYECKHTLAEEDKINFLATGEWVKTSNYDSDLRGFQLPQMYSMAPKAGPAPVFARKKIKGDIDPAGAQEFHNSGLGKPFIAAGSKVELSTIDSLLRSHLRNDRLPARGRRVMGIDVGKWLHYEISEYTVENGVTNDINALSTCINLTHGKVAHFEELDPLMREHQVLIAVIDANPERRKAREFASRFPGHVYLCYYSNGLKGNEVSLNEDAASISVDRTSWLDLAIGRFNSTRITLPRDTTDEYKDHIQAIMRKYEYDTNGNPVGVWISVGDDHYAHARNYAEIALPIAVSKRMNQDIKSFL